MMDDKELKKDPNYIYQTERTLKQTMFLIILALCVVIVFLVIGFFVLLPLKQKQPYLVFFSNADTNFVRVEQANYNIRADEALLKSILASYLLNREIINIIDDIERFEKVRIQSSYDVWDMFEKIVKQDGSIYQEKDIYCNVKIINLSILSKNIANIDFVTETFNIGEPNKILTKRYRATLEYDFKNQELSYDNVPENPSGFVVKGYALTEIFDNTK
ncbi:VirB8/TrbF family protein [Helicobacter bilis]|uniref:VirB8/TrbF family protein n=1 Tax=Helicobacter bilis TaxID=37372 RepID=UPI0025583A17|nr:VirB8/TrbF family protein [Helicobacter bilis]